MRFNEFNASKIEEGPIANKVGSAIGKTVGTVAKGVGAVAGGIAGIKGAVKKGFQAGKTTVAGGGDAPATATTPATGTAPQPAAAPATGTAPQPAAKPATATPAAAPATGTAPQPAAAPAQPAAKPGATAEPKKKLTQFGAFKQGFADELTVGTAFDTAERRREKEKAAKKIAPPTKGTTVGIHQYDGKQWVDTATNTPVDKNTATALQKKYDDEQIAKSPASSASGTPAAAAAATPTAAGAPAAAAGAATPTAAGAPAADAAPQVDIKSISTQIASANLPAINALMKSLDIDPNEKPAAAAPAAKAPAAKPAAAAPTAKPAAAAPAAKAPTAKPAKLPPIKVGGQTVKPTDPSYAKLAQAAAGAAR